MYKRKPRKNTFPDHCHDLMLNIEHFNKKYIVDAVTGCWNWVGAMHRQGYGMTAGYRIADQKSIMLTAHRASWRIHRGPITKPNIMHMCHNPACVNPQHLAEGNQRDNMLKMIAAGRQNVNRGAYGARGEPSRLKGRPKVNHKYKYTQEEIQFFRTAELEEIMARYNQTRAWAYGRRHHSRTGYVWLPHPGDK